MIRKLIEKLKFGSSKAKTPEDTNVFKESEKKQSQDKVKWNTNASIVVFIG